MEKLTGGVWVTCVKSDLIDGDVYRISVGGTGWQRQTYKTPQPLQPIRIISTGAMQRRFTIPEEVFITSDTAATVIKSRLMNSDYCDLDFQDTIDGITYICGVLFVGGVIADEAVAIANLLRDGTEAEKA